MVVERAKTLEVGLAPSLARQDLKTQDKTLSCLDTPVLQDRQDLVRTSKTASRITCHVSRIVSCPCSRVLTHLAASHSRPCSHVSSLVSRAESKHEERNFKLNNLGPYEACRLLVDLYPRISIACFLLHSPLSNIESLPTLRRQLYLPISPLSDIESLPTLRR